MKNPSTYEYIEDRDTINFKEFVVIFLLVSIFMWGIGTVTYWIADQEFGGNRSTLSEFMFAHWEFIKNLRPW